MKKLYNFLENEKENITSLEFDSKTVKAGSIYFCLDGTNVDGHDFAVSAVENGAICIVCQRELENIPDDITQIIVQDTREAISLASHKFFGEPSRKLKMIGVTGTNGKTTTTYIIKNILETAGKKTGIIGTNEIEIMGNKYPSDLTTPDPTYLHKTFKMMVDAGVEYCVMEASAHALTLRKLKGVIFDVSAFTNLSQDHLDFFGTMENYFEAKRILFTPEYTKCSVINADDEYGQKIIKSCKTRKLTYGSEMPSDIFGLDLKMSVNGLTYILNSFDDVEKIKFNLPGKFNMFNSLCAIAVCRELEIDMKKIVKGVRTLKKVDGRFNIINTEGCSIIIDYAHTPEGLENIISAIREFAKKRIITVFGCGGDRDKTKRPLMGEVASRLSDYCFITSDNPRTEDRNDIISNVMSGILCENRQKVESNPSREDAIKSAIEFSKEGDIVLIAGKGCEPYMDEGGVKRDYKDEDYVKSLIKN
ncbi:MAG: UDP-N-acetylmuramoyl-L-alanyl-D-glutamate--2,6-diaminopimelate ligase [Firmicutes bacterium]|nr:UDP-N-acetylmuramoyl-L-alanyl-D-glutamate--2,6-diaminopimelate ligase [Bacillota bacterium]MCL2256171.1 UDP-N-acetylmuramoyl-L-alanyl-D-glutamate--2,6-diaminopimelate ligase [Bacillota bacterium]